MPAFGPPLNTWSAGLAVIGGLVGLAYGGDAPHSFPVETPAGTIPVGDLTLPVALVVFGGMVGRAVSSLVAWRPHVVVEHRYPGRAEDTSP